MKILKKKRIGIMLAGIAVVIFAVSAIVLGIFFGKNSEENRDKDKINQAYYTDPQEIGLSGYGTYAYLPDGDEDGDGLTDGNEVLAGLNPNSKKTDGEVLDTEVTFKEAIEEEDCILELEGNADIYGSYIEKSNITGLAKTPGVLSNVYEYNKEGNGFSAEISFEYSEWDLRDMGIDEENLSVCMYSDGVFTPIESFVDKDYNIVTARLKNSSRYALCNTEKINTEAIPQVLLLIDNSGSMYPKEVLEESDENDVDFKRLDMASQLIEMAEGKIEFGLAKFTGTYTLMAELGSDEELLNEKLESIRTGEENFNGTYIETSLMKSINHFNDNDNDHRKFVVMLTDGYSTEGQGLFSIKIYNEEDIIHEANDSNVTLIIIGLGNNVDSESLTKMATGTDGMYIGAYNADALEEIYRKIMSAINYNLEDSDGDGEQDRILVADSGFDAEANGFPYENYKVIDITGEKISGQCFGLATLCQLYYTGKLPVTLDSVEGLKAGIMGVSGELSSEGYNAEGSFFTRGSRESVILNNAAMENYTNSTLEIYNKIRSIPVKKRYTNEDGHLKFTDEVMELVESDSLIVCGTENVSKQKYEDWEYTSYDDVYINLYNVDEASLTSEQLQSYKDFNMIFRLYTLQLEKGTESFQINSADLESNAQLKAMDRLIGMVQEGTPAVISSCAHSINITRIYRDLESPDEYILVVYNNNNPGEEYELTVKRRKNKAALDVTEWINDYIYTVYDTDGTFTGEKGKKIDMTIEDMSWLWE